MAVNRLAVEGTEAMDLLLENLDFPAHGSGRMARDRGGSPVDAEIGCRHVALETRCGSRAAVVGVWESG